jgi:hypothetical protein
MKLANSYWFQLFSLILRNLQKYLTRIPFLIWLNALVVIVLALLGVYAKLESKGQGIENLFSDPFNIGIYYLGWFTAISEIFWCSAISICLFTIGLLPKGKKESKQFLFVSALIMALLYFDDRFRLTLIICAFFAGYTKVKTVVYSLYGILLIWYGKKFWSKIKQTPYLPLLLSFALFAFSSAVDITPLPSRGLHAMLEDGTKLIGLINLTVYFCYICRLEVQKLLLNKLSQS